LLAWGERLSRGRGYLVHLRHLHAPLHPDSTVAAAQLNSEMERLIAECPQQYLWGYARYKTPKKDLYA
jgi:Kdo2-lipid IVA lauroyltransferase/acyltransferase